MVIPGAILTTLGRLPWRWIAVGAGVLGALWFVHHRGYHSGVASQAPVIASLNATIDNVRAATAKAQADDLAHKQAIEARDARIAQEKTDALEKQLADARAAVADYIRLHAAPPADPGRGGAAGVSGATPAPGAADGAGGEAIVPAGDLRICAGAVVKAEGWRDWWRAVSEGPR